MQGIKTMVAMFNLFKHIQTVRSYLHILKINECILLMIQTQNYGKAIKIENCIQQ